VANDEKDREYEVGYRRPPRNTRFTPGRSGNPKGRPKQHKNLKTDLLEELREYIEVRERGRTRKMSKQRALVKSTVTRALSDNPKATDTIFMLYRTLLLENEPVQPNVPLNPEEREVLEGLKERLPPSPDVGSEDPQKGGDDR
jgi:uncharacterized protein DUF5681